MSIVRSENSLVNPDRHFIYKKINNYKRKNKNSTSRAVKHFAQIKLKAIQLIKFNMEEP